MKNFEEFLNEHESTGEPVTEPKLKGFDKFETSVSVNESEVITEITVFKGDLDPTPGPDPTEGKLKIESINVKSYEAANEYYTNQYGLEIPEYFKDNETMVEWFMNFNKNAKEDEMPGEDIIHGVKANGKHYKF